MTKGNFEIRTGRIIDLIHSNNIVTRYFITKELQKKFPAFDHRKGLVDFFVFSLQSDDYAETLNEILSCIARATIIVTRIEYYILTLFILSTTLDSGIASWAALKVKNIIALFGYIV